MIRVVVRPFQGFERGAVLDRPLFFWRDDPNRMDCTLPLEDVVRAGLASLERPRKPKAEDRQDARTRAA